MDLVDLQQHIVISCKHRDGFENPREKGGPADHEERVESHGARAFHLA